MQIIVVWQNSSCEAEALRLAAILEVPALSAEEQKTREQAEQKKTEKSKTKLDKTKNDATTGRPHRYILFVTEKRLELLPETMESKTKIFAEFLKGAAGYRKQKGGGMQQLIAKAIGLRGRSGKKPSVLDATAGLGQDAFVLACLGCEVLLVERSKPIALLLIDGLRRAFADPNLDPEVQTRMKVIMGDAKDVLQNFLAKKAPDIIVLDPMFPQSSKKALTKIEMRIIRDIVGEDKDADTLLEQALLLARERVVVKRPIRAVPLASIKPNFVVKGVRNRYDVYVVKGKY